MNDKDERHAAADAPPIGLLFDPMEQMRELLFGTALRETDKRLDALQARLEDMRAEFQARLDALDGRLAELQRDADARDAALLQAIGDAIGELGATIRDMSAKRKA